MSTRTNVILQNDDCKVILYRHCDGYPEETGVDIYKKVKDAVDGGKYSAYGALLESFLAERYKAEESISGKEKAVYEITDSIHGDIDHLYKVEVFRTYKYSEEREANVFAGYDAVIFHSEIDKERAHRDMFERKMTGYTLFEWIAYLTSLGVEL